MAKSIKIRKVPATTNNITRAIINFLLSKGHYAARINTQGQFDERAGFWKKTGSTKGVYDIIACIHGKFIAIDVKNKHTRDTLNEDQKIFKAGVIESGGVAIEVEGYKEFVDWFDGNYDYFKDRQELFIKRKNVKNSPKVEK